jgi:hypothetical protein
MPQNTAAKSCEPQETLTTLNNMAALLKITGKASGAHSITNQVFMERTTTLHSHHPKRLTSMNNLAAVLEDLGTLVHLIYLRSVLVNSF